MSSKFQYLFHFLISTTHYNFYLIFTIPFLILSFIFKFYLISFQIYLFHLQEYHLTFYLISLSLHLLSSLLFFNFVPIMHPLLGINIPKQFPSYPLVILINRSPSRLPYRLYSVLPKKFTNKTSSVALIIVTKNKVSK